MNNVEEQNKAINKPGTQTEVMISIMLAGILIAGALVFLGFQMKAGPAKAPTIDTVQLKKELRDDIITEIQNGEFLDQAIQAGIQRYVQKQQEAQRQAQEERQKASQEKAKNVRRVSLERDHVDGNPQALISLIEYSDFECPFCKAYHETPKKVLELYGDKVNRVYRHYPLQFHNPAAQKEAEAAECANEVGGREAFWKYADLLFQRTATNGKGIPADQYLKIAEEIGLNKEQFQACQESGKHAGRVQEDFAEGSNSGITGTPGTILLNNKTGAVKLLSGAVPVEALQTEIDQMLKE